MATTGQDLKFRTMLYTSPSQLVGCVPFPGPTHRTRSRFLRMKLYTPYLLVLHSDVGRYGTDKPNQLPVCGCPDAAVPGLFPPRGMKGPAKELSAIFKSKHIILIFNIVLTKQYIEFIQLGEERNGREEDLGRQ